MLVDVRHIILFSPALKVLDINYGNINNWLAHITHVLFNLTVSVST